MHQDTRRALDGIDEILAKRDIVAGELWDILTALRAYDGPEDMIKETTAGAIRSAAFPKLTEAIPDDAAWSSFPGPFFPGGLRNNPVYDYRESRRGSNHYVHHADYAAKLLGLR